MHSRQMFGFEMRPASGRFVNGALGYKKCDLDQKLNDPNGVEPGCSARGEGEDLFRGQRECPILSRDAGVWESDQSLTGETVPESERSMFRS